MAQSLTIDKDHPRTMRHASTDAEVRVTDKADYWSHRSNGYRDVTDESGGSRRRANSGGSSSSSSSASTGSS